MSVVRSTTGGVLLKDCFLICFSRKVSGCFSSISPLIVSRLFPFDLQRSHSALTQWGYQVFQVVIMQMYFRNGTVCARHKLSIDIRKVNSLLLLVHAQYDCPGCWPRHEGYYTFVFQ